MIGLIVVIGVVMIRRIQSRLYRETSVVTKLLLLELTCDCTTGSNVVMFTTVGDQHYQCTIYRYYSLKLE